ncbi:MAG: hypothetical protein HOQ44_11250 [Nocardia sp.]|nr:hypothetical protein [Nocardia sp.]
MIDIDNSTLGAVAGFALPAVGGLFKNPLYGAAGGLIGGAVHGLMNDHSGWNLVADMAIGAAGGGLGASFGRKAGEALLAEGKAGRTVGEQLSNLTRGERAGITATSATLAGGFTELPLIGTEIASLTGTLPTTSIGRGDA